MRFLLKPNTLWVLVAVVLVIFVAVNGFLFYHYQLARTSASAQPASTDLGVTVPAAQRDSAATGEDAEQGSTSCGAPRSESVFVQGATPDNTFENRTYLDSTLTNENPDAVLFVTQNWNPEGDGGVYNAHPIGVFYDVDAQMWTIFNQDLAAIPIGAAFSVMCG